jgi:hypothetical protein
VSTCDGLNVHHIFFWHCLWENIEKMCSYGLRQDAECSEWSDWYDPGTGTGTAVDDSSIELTFGI